MTEVYIFNRAKAHKYSYKPHSHSSIIISICDTIREPCSFLRNPMNKIKGILRLSFDDIDREIPGLVAISDDDAKKIAEFVGRYIDKVDRIIVHCEAGVSRSAGCAAAIIQHYYGDTGILNNSDYSPNPLVYRKVLEALT